MKTRPSKTGTWAMRFVVATLLAAVGLVGATVMTMACRGGADSGIGGALLRSSPDSVGATPALEMEAQTAAVPASPMMARQRDARSHQAGERYTKVAENQLVDASEDALATFSLDVDTASYTIMRRDVRSGTLPRPESVRVEEYVNFFDYADAPPSGDDDAPFAVHLETAPSHFGEGRHLLRIGVQAMDVPAERRPAANLVFLVDVSGSMATPDKLGLVQFSLATLVDALRPDDTIGIVVYAGSDAVLLQPTAVAERGTIHEAIQGLRAGGGTNGAAGIRTAYQLAQRHHRPGGINRVILCTDGDFNVGVTGEALINMVERYREQGTTLTVLGFGRGNLNDADMEQLADRGNGSYAYLDGRNEALRVMQRDLGGTLQVVAKDVKVQVAMNPDVVARFRVVGYENRTLAHEDFDDDAVDAAEVGSGQFVTAFIEYELHEGVVAGDDPRELAEVRLRYKAPDGDASMLVTRSIAASATRPSFASASAAFRFGAAVAELAEILRHSQHSEGARFDEVERIAREALPTESSDARELLELVSMAGRLWAADRPAAD